MNLFLYVNHIYISIYPSIYLSRYLIFSLSTSLYTQLCPGIMATGSRTEIEEMCADAVRSYFVPGNFALPLLSTDESDIFPVQVICSFLIR